MWIFWVSLLQIINYIAGNQVTQTWAARNGGQGATTIKLHTHRAHDLLSNYIDFHVAAFYVSFIKHVFINWLMNYKKIVSRRYCRKRVVGRLAWTNVDLPLRDDRHSFQNNVQLNTRNINTQALFEVYTLEITVTSPEDDGVIWQHSAI